MLYNLEMVLFVVQFGDAAPGPDAVPDCCYSVAPASAHAQAGSRHHQLHGTGEQVEETVR